MNRYLKSLRWPFLSASILPFVYGSFLPESRINLLVFLAGLTAVVSAHLAANLANDHADSRSGADDRDQHAYGFFGGSKVIQHRLLSSQTVLLEACFFSFVAVSAMTALTIYTGSLAVPLCGLAALGLGWAYSQGPLRLAYRGFGELTVLFLFGPLIVAGAAYLQGGSLTNPDLWISGLPFGLLTSAVLVANEVPDHEDDRHAGKRTLIVKYGAEYGALLYGILVGMAFLWIIALVAAQIAGAWCLLALAGILPAWRTISGLREYHGDKQKSVGTSRMAVLTLNLSGMLLIVGVLL